MHRYIIFGSPSTRTSGGQGSTAQDDAIVSFATYRIAAMWRRLGGIDSSNVSRLDVLF